MIQYQQRRMSHSGRKLKKKITEKPDIIVALMYFFGFISARKKKNITESNSG